MDRTKEIIRIVKNAGRTNITPDPEERLFDTGFLESFALPDIIAALERVFRIHIPDCDLPYQFETIASMDRYVALAIEGQRA